MILLALIAIPVIVFALLMYLLRCGFDGCVVYLSLASWPSKYCSKCYAVWLYCIVVLALVLDRLIDLSTNPLTLKMSFYLTLLYESYVFMVPATIMRIYIETYDLAGPCGEKTCVSCWKDFLVIWCCGMWVLRGSRSTDSVFMTRLGFLRTLGVPSVWSVQSLSIAKDFLASKNCFTLPFMVSHYIIIYQ